MFVSMEGVSESPILLSRRQHAGRFFTRGRICYATCERLLILPNSLLLLATSRPTHTNTHTHIRSHTSWPSWSRAWLHTQVALMGLRAAANPSLLSRPQPSSRLSPHVTADDDTQRVKLPQTRRQCWPG